MRQEELSRDEENYVVIAIEWYLSNGPGVPPVANMLGRGRELKCFRSTDEHR